MEVEAGLTILQAAEVAGIAIPSLCYHRGLAPCTSCYVCVVGIAGRNGFVPSCATKVQEGMSVDCSSADVQSARRTALELLLSDHVGDCAGPCELACPAGLDVPAMLRAVQQGQMGQARSIVSHDLAFARTLGAFCPGFCEKACRRGRHDAPLAIRRVHEALSAAPGDAASGGASSARSTAALDCGSSAANGAVAIEHVQGKHVRVGNHVCVGKHVCVMGASAVAVSAAYYLALSGQRVTLLTRGRPLATEILAAHPQAAAQLEGDLAQLTALGIEVDAQPHPAVDVAAIRAACDALLLADDTLPADAQVDEAGGVFQAERAPKYLVHCVGAGRSLARKIDAHLAGATPPLKPFSIHMGHLQEGEMERFLELCPGEARVAHIKDPSRPLAANELPQEAARCLYCDCRDKRDCRLRLYSAQYRASAVHFGSPRRRFEQQADATIVYESGKCIACGLCVQIAARDGRANGPAFIGRGFGVRVQPASGVDMATALGESAGECIDACPTGALAWRKET